LNFFKSTVLKARSSGASFDIISLRPVRRMS